MPKQNKRVAATSSLSQRLQDPVQLRMFFTGLVLLIGYGAIYVPLSESIAGESRMLAEQEKRHQLAVAIDHLEQQRVKVADRLPKETDTSQWMQYLLGGIRQWPVQLHSLDPKPQRRIGPFPVDEFQIELEGEFDHLDAFVHWIETNTRLLRIDRIKLKPSRENERRLVLSLTVLALNG